MSKRIKYFSILLFLLCICLLIYFNLPNELERNPLTSKEEFENEIKENLKDLETYIDRYPNEEDALVEAMHLQHTLGELNKASALGLRLIELNPDNYIYYHSVANIYSSKEDWEEAIQYRKRAYSLEASIDMLYYLATTNLALDANYSLKLLNSIDSNMIEPENTSILDFRAALDKYIQDDTINNVFELSDYIYDRELIEYLFQKSIKSDTSTDDILKIKEYIEYTYGP